MENKLLFGDTVRHKSDKNKTYGIVLDTNDIHPAVKWQNIWGIQLENEEYLELIPHSDTARLNWLEKQMMEDRPDQIIFDGFAFTTIENERKGLSGDAENIREAIDHEMKKSCSTPSKLTALALTLTVLLAGCQTISTDTAKRIAQWHEIKDSISERKKQHDFLGM